VPLINAAQVDTLEFNAPIHRLANRGATGTSTLMTLSAKLNSTNGPSVNYSGFPATKPAASSSIGGMTLTPNSVTDYYAGQTGYYLKSANTIAVVPSAGGDVNTLTVSQTFSNPTGVTGASASATFYYDTQVTAAPTCSINALTVPSATKVSGLSILYNNTANVTIDASANNMGKYFYRSPLITYNCTYDVNVGTKSETNLDNVRTSDISGGNMFTNGSLNFSSLVALTGINNGAYSTTPITIAASANNIVGAGVAISKSFNIIMDPLSHALAYSVPSIPVLTPTAASGALTVSTNAVTTYGARIWSAPITTSATGVFCPDFSYNGIFYATMPYDNNGSLTSTDPSGCKQDLLISNGVFTTPANAINRYIDYSGFAGNAGFNYSTITPTAGTYRFATFCWKMPTMAAGAYSFLSFYIESVTTNITREVDGQILANGEPLQVYYAFQNVGNPSFATSTPNTNWNTVWISANTSTPPFGETPSSYPSASTSWNYNQTIITNRYGRIRQGTYFSPSDLATHLAAGTAPFFKLYTPAYAITAAQNIYLYLRICLPMDKNLKFGGVYATLNKTS
jgi:hypothetical protein